MKNHRPSNLLKAPPAKPTEALNRIKALIPYELSLTEQFRQGKEMAFAILDEERLIHERQLHAELYRDLGLYAYGSAEHKAVFLNIEECFRADQVSKSQCHKTTAGAVTQGLLLIIMNKALRKLGGLVGCVRSTANKFDFIYYLTQDEIFADRIELTQELKNTTRDRGKQNRSRLLVCLDEDVFTLDALDQLLEDDTKVFVINAGQYKNHHANLYDLDDLARFVNGYFSSLTLKVAA